MQIIINFVSNELKFSQHGSVVKINLKVNEIVPKTTKEASNSNG